MLSIQHRTEIKAERVTAEIRPCAGHTKGMGLFVTKSYALAQNLDWSPGPPGN